MVIPPRIFPGIQAVAIGALVTGAPLCIPGQIEAQAGSVQQPVTPQSRLQGRLQGVRQVTLAEAIAMAQANSPATIGARGQETGSRAAVRSAYGAFLPNINASVGTSRQFTGRGTTTRVNESGETITIAGDQWAYSTGFSLSAQLFNFNRLPNLRAAKAQVSAAQQNLIVQNASVALQVEQQFFAALAARESEEAARVQLQQAEQQLDAARRRVIAGAATASDSLRATTEVANARLSLMSAQVDLRQSNATLTRLAGSTVPLSAALDDSMAVALDTVVLDSAILMAHVGGAPDVIAASAQLAAANAQRQAAKSGYFPTIGASYSRSGSGLDSRFGYGNDPFSYGGHFSLSLSYPIFNQFSREQQVQQAKINETNAEASLRDTQLEIRQLVLQYLDTRRLAQEQVRVQQSAIVAAEEDLRVQQQRYDLNLSTMLDVLTAQTALNQARVNLITARNTLRLATAQLRALVGADVVQEAAQ